MLTNIVGGLQGIIDHAMVGNLVGFTGNAAIGVSWQIFIIVIVFISSLFTGMSVLVARFVGAGNSEMADRTVYQAFLTAIALSFGIIAPLGYFISPWLLDFVNAAPAVHDQALPFIRIMFLFSGGMMLFFMLSIALRSAGDARTPMIIGVAMTLLNAGLNVVLIRGLGPIPAFGTKGAAMGTCIASGVVSIYSLYHLWNGSWVVAFPRHRGGRAHQADRCPGDEREKLRIGDGERRLRGRALRERADEREHQHAADVHRDSLNPRRQAEAEERADDRPVGGPAAVPRKGDDPAPVPEMVQ
jgi:Na+-driven multidrug efflux pump